MRNICKLFQPKMVCLLVGLLATLPGFAQGGADSTSTKSKGKSDVHQRWRLTAYGGVTIPFLDVKSTVSPAFGLSLRFVATHSFSFELHGIKSWMTSNNDKYKRDFKNSFIAYSGRAVYSFYHSAGFHSHFPAINPYVSIGVGQMFNDVTDVKPGNSNTRNLSPNKSMTLVIPVGVGAKFYLGPHFDFSIHSDYYIAKNDILDGFRPNVDGNYYQDRFLTILVGLSYKLGRGDEHLEWHDHQQVVKDKIKALEEKLLATESRFVDSDKDGVIDELDQEPGTLEGVRVDTKGITMDTDYDGLKDDVDKCPGAPGPVENNGCPQEKPATAPDLDGKYVKDTDEARLNPNEVTTTRNIINDPKNAKYKNTPNDESATKPKGKNRKGSKGDSGNADLDNYPIYKIDLNEAVGANDSTFYIIGGSFVKKYNAVRFSKKVNKLGLTSKVLYFESANLYRVTFNEFRSREKCLEELKKIRETVDNEAWLFAH